MSTTARANRAKRTRLIVSATFGLGGDDALFCVLAFQVRHLLFDQPAVRLVAAPSRDAGPKPRRDFGIGRAALQRGVKNARCYSPAVEDSTIHWARINIIMNGPITGRTCLVEHARQPEKSINIVAPAAWKFTAASEIGSHFVLPEFRYGVCSYDAGSIPVVAEARNVMAITTDPKALKPSYFQDALEAVGRTPLVRLNKVMDGAPCLVLAKVEYVNPGGSVKDRPAVEMIRDAETRGVLKAGATIIEATSGNTGTGLAMAAAIRGYRCILVMPDKMSKEKIDLLKAYGAEVVVTPTAVANESPESYYSVANRLTAEIPGAFQPDQWHNANNPDAHYRTTGPEIWEQTAGTVTHFVSGMGTGGTISGTARFLKEQNPKIHVVGADPEGSVYSGDTPKSYKVEGIGMSYLPQTVDMRVIDKILRITDKESFLMARRVAREEGLLVGGSSGTAVAAAARVAKDLPADAVLVVVMPDSGRGYMSKIFNDEWMTANGFLADDKRKETVGDVLRSKTPRPMLITVTETAVVREALEKLRENEISQLPVVRGNEVVGSVNDVAVMQAVFDHSDLMHKPVSEVMGRPFPMLEANVEVDRAYKLLTLANPAIVVTDGGKPVGVLTRQDIISYLSALA